MKFCAVICEYNPFHNGHLYQFGEIRKAGYEHILCVMSGNFTQRGEPAVLDKFTRARHAVMSGADAVIELPAAFATAPAELFASGAVHILSALSAVEALAFGCESGTREQFLAAAEALNGEDKEFRQALKEKMKDGTSYIRARNAAALERFPALDEKLLSSPNNILGVEYCRALLGRKSTISPLPILRTGSSHGSAALAGNYSSATAIRAALSDGSRKAKKALKSNLPAHVLNDLSGYVPLPYGQAALCALLRAEPKEIAETPDCSEGLENRILSIAKSNPEMGELLAKTTSKRYTESRVRRILLQNLLGVRAKDVKDYLSSPLYANVLAVRRQSAEEILSALSGELPVLVRKSDALQLKRDALACLELDMRANALYGALTGKYANEYGTLFV